MARGPAADIVAVLVLYRCPPDRSPALVSLARAWDRRPDAGLGLRLVVYDNSPSPQRVTLPLPFRHEYIHDADNGGLAAAYNRALAADPGGGWQWLLLLDQDSCLADDFFVATAAALAAIAGDDAVVAVVPWASNHGVPISPARLTRWGRIVPLRRPCPGPCRGRTTGINSGTLLRKRFLRGIGGFDPRFRLDYLDHWLFAEIDRRGGRVYASGATIDHDLSIGSAVAPVSPGRYRSVLRAETRFYRDCLGPTATRYHLLALVGRIGRQLLTGRRGLAGVTARHLLAVVRDRWQTD